jgi:hypothetical protein
MTTKTFKVVGITVHNGNAKVRFTDDMVRRVKQFTKGGATRCDFIELPSEMSKVDALKYMLTCKEYSSADDQALIEDTLTEKERDLGKGEIKVKSKPDLAKIAARPRKDVTVDDVLNVITE